jgi:hypothetical protein
VVNEVFRYTIVNVVVNITALLFAVYGLRGHLLHSQLVLVISSVYAASVMHASFKLARNGSRVLDVSRNLLRHGIHAPREWVRSNVARGVEAQFHRMGRLKRLFYWFSGAPSKETLIEKLTGEIWRVVMVKLLLTLAIVVAYVVIFSVCTRPVLIREATHLNFLQAFLWPFGFSVDYFLSTHLVSWIERALRI